MNDLVSIITPCYNSEKFIEDTILSVINQDYESIEHIIINDGSTDSSEEIINKYDRHIKYLKIENGGANRARNIGAKIAKGKYFMFLDSDDILDKNTIKILVSHQNDIDVTACKTSRLLYINGHWVESPMGMSFLPSGSDEISSWLTGWYIPPCSILWSKFSYSKVIKWDEKLSINQDGDIMLRALLSGVKIIYVNEAKAFYRKSNQNRMSVSSKINDKKSIESNLMVIEKVIDLMKRKNIINKYKTEIGYYYYHIARHSFGFDDKLAKYSLNCSKEYIGNKNFGSIYHKIFSYVFGLEKKEKIAKYLSYLGLGTKKRINRNNLIKNNL